MIEKIQFDINPHVVRQLGEELVPDEITALMELVKNSYDADATYVNIEINTSENCDKLDLKYPKHKGYIIVEDDGFGMDKDTILKSWLIISYSAKRDMKSRKEKTKQGRTPLGEKGLGRLSTQRLADYCEILTTKEGSNDKVHIAFNWKDFDKTEKLGDVPVKLDTGESESNGTTLVLSNLKHTDVWKGTNLERFKGLLSQMISPYQETKPFEVFLKVNGQIIDLIQENQVLRDISISNFKFNFDTEKLTLSGQIKLEKLIGNRKDEYYKLIAPDKGKKFADYCYNNKKIREKDIQFKLTEKYFINFNKAIDFNFDIPGLEYIDGEKANPGSFFGELNEFAFRTDSYEEEIIKGIFDRFANFIEFAQSQAGIKIYRNGFAVQPYGFDKSNDWLNLSQAQTSGSSYYGLRPKNTIGYIAIDEGTNSNLRDKTDRNGLIENPYSKNFFLLVTVVRNEINRFLEQIRRSYNDFIRDSITENNKIKTVSQAFNSINSTVKSTQKVKSNFYQAKEKVKEIRKNTKEYIDSVEKNPLFVSKVDKEVARKIKEIFEQLELIESSLLELSPVIDQTSQLTETVDILKPKIEILEEQLENFSSLAALGIIAESISHEFNNIADNLSERVSIFSNKFEKNKIDKKDIYVLIEYINSTVSGLRVQLKHIDPSLKYLKEKKEQIDLLEYFQNENDFYTNRFKKNNIELKIKADVDFSVYMNKGKLTQILDNILLNSEYWLLERQKQEKKFKAVINIRIEKPWIYLYDNGYGISPSIEDNIFEAFVSSKPHKSGRGLGLFIVQQLLDSSGCIINLEPKRNELKRKYVFAINLSNVVK